MKNKFLIAAFLEGFFLLSFELIAAQLLHPIYGSSYFVWISILGVTMLASSVGYFLGGIISGKEDKILNNYLFVSLLIICVYSLSLYRLNELLFINLADFGLIEASVLQTIGLLFIPLVFITSYNPIIVNFITNQKAGISSSRVFFSSTIGGIVSIYLLAFAVFPSVDFILLMKIFPLFIVLIAIFVLFKNEYLVGVGILAVTSVFFFIGVTQYQKEKLKGINSKVIYRSHGVMGEIEIREEMGDRRYISLNRTTQSAILKKNGMSLWSYPYRVATYASIAPPKSDVLVAGLGGGILINHLIDLDFNIDCIEFDRRMIGVAKKYMGLRPSAEIKIDDFRHYINASDKKYDLIVLDLSKGESIPTNVYTVEAFQKMLKMLKPNGFIVLHYFSDVYGTGKIGLKSVLKTFNRAGAFAGLIKKQETDKNPEQIIIASNKPEIISNLKFRMPLNIINTYGFITQNIFDKNFDTTDGLILNDGNNSLEKVQLNVVKEIRARLRENEYKTFYDEGK